MPSQNETPSNAGEINTQHFASRYAAIVESSDDAIISKNLSGIIESWNSGAERLFGFTAQEAIGKPVQILIPPGRENEEPGIISRIKSGERIDHYETVRRRKDGSLVDISLTVSPIKDQTGKVVGASKIARDISERKRIDMLQRRLSSIVESSDDAIISKDLNGIIQSWNPGAERIFGYTLPEAVGQSITFLIPKDRLHEEVHILDQIRRGERIDHFETIRLRKDGAQIHISLAVSPIKDSFGTIIGASKIARDITQRVAAQTELQKARRELDAVNADLEKRVAERTGLLNEAVAQMEEFSYTVSHDLRSPVRAMSGYATAILEHQTGHLTPLEIEYLERIVRGSIRMDKMIRDVLTYSRLNKATFLIEPIDLDRLISDTLLSYEEFQPSRLQTTFRGPLGKVRAHETSLVQALSNILGNAVKFVEPGMSPKIEIWTETKNDRVRLWIKDNGIGIKPEYQARIFGMFERAHQDPQYEGTGVGLAIVRKIMEKMNGQAGVESNGANGCAFWLEFPA